ncbi:MAG: DUF58 domain-containing protein [Pseudomonadota bacterium]
MILNGRALLAIGVVLGLVTAALWVGAPYDVLWRLSAVIVLLALLLERLITLRTRLDVSLVQPRLWYLGLPVEVQLRVQHNRRGALQLQLGIDPPAALDVAGEGTEEAVLIAEHGDHAFRWELTGARLGEHSWPAQPVCQTGPFGLARWVSRVPLQAETSTPLAREQHSTAVTRVEPEPLLHNLGAAAELSFGQRPQSRASDQGIEFRTLRAYAPGDPPTRISWKSLARSGALMVREQEDDQRLDLAVLIDSGKSAAYGVGPLDVSGLLGNLAARLSEWALSQGDRVALMTYANVPLERLPPRAGVAQLRSVRTLLAAMQPRPVEANPLAAVLALRHLLSQRALVLILTNLDDAASGQQLVDACRLLRPKHLPMLVSVEDPALAAMTRNPAHTVDTVYQRLAAREIERGSMLATRELERLGALVVRALPTHLESRVFDTYRRVKTLRSL